MKQFDVAVRYTNGTDDHYIFDRMGCHWETDAETIDAFISELVNESYDECNIAFDVKENVDNPLVSVYAYDVDYPSNREELTKEMYEEDL